MDPEDAELIRRYLAGSHEAFAEITRRHAGLVMAAARRQTTSRAMAEEVAQSVFISLARDARKLKPGTPLAAWLYLATRHTAMNAGRTEARRQAREAIALEISTMNSTPSAWTQIEPLLDEAMAALPEADRTAVLLRYFENRSLREVGAAIGASDDTAQKRVSRAVDQLRAFFAREGIAVSAVSLISDLSSNGVDAVPGPAVTSISAGAIAHVAATGTAIGTAATFAMTTLQKTTLAAVLAVLASAGLYEARAIQLLSGEFAGQETEIARLQAASSRGNAERAALQQQMMAARTRLNLAVQPLPVTTPADPDIATAMSSWIDRIDRIKAAFASDPKTRIPELTLVPEETWFAIAQDVQAASPENLRKTMSRARGEAVMAFTKRMQTTMTAYLKAHDDMLPASTAELAALFDPPIDPTTLDRYEMTFSGPVASVAKIRGMPIYLREKAVVDLEYDSYLQMGTSVWWTDSALDRAGAAAADEYAKANGGARPTDPAQLLPYLPQPVDPEKLKRYAK